MPRAANLTRDEIIERSLARFWTYGYLGTSIDDLTRETGATRHALYQTFGGKRDLFLACLDAYRDAVVTPAFARVEEKDSGLAEIAGYFEHQIARGEAHGLPGPGCLIANTMTEMAPHDDEIAAHVHAHHARLAAGFRRALANASRGAGLSRKELGEFAELLATSAQGLWSFSRTVTDAADLRRFVTTLLHLIEHRIAS
jgi:TetR/AcrR family transcriptional regulator, transcriptional repressor for nem operon